MALRPEIETRVRASEARAAAAQAEADELAAAVDTIVEEDNAIPVEAFDDPSIVRHIAEATQEVKRARRESNALQRKVASGYVTLTRRR